VCIERIPVFVPGPSTSGISSFVHVPGTTYRTCETYRYTVSLRSGTYQVLTSFLGLLLAYVELHYEYTDIIVEIQNFTFLVFSIFKALPGTNKLYVRRRIGILYYGTI
jgi:hypothetical protein